MKRMLWLVVLVWLVSLVTASTAVAIADPDSPPRIYGTYVYQGLLESGDVGVLVDYYLDYATLPAEPANEAYLCAFIDADGVTQLKATQPYPYNNKGYRRGVMWMYFTAAEASAYGLSATNVNLYRIMLVGNPTVPSGWSGTPPRTTAGIDIWHTTGDMKVLLALRVLNLAETLELSWLRDMVEPTSAGNKLTLIGEEYFTAVIPNLRQMAPAAFAQTVIRPDVPRIDYSTSFGAVVTGTVVSGSPVTLSPGDNNLTATGAGSITVTLNQGTVGTASGTIVTGSPVTLRAGRNTVQLTGAGTFTVSVRQQDTTTGLEASVVGTALDLTDVASMFGMSRWVFSGIVWIILSVIACASVYRAAENYGYGASAGKAVMMVFNLCLIGGILLGLLHPIVGVLMFIGFNALVAYVLFFRHANV